MDIALKRVLIDCNAIDTLEEKIKKLGCDDPFLDRIIFRNDALLIEI